MREIVFTFLLAFFSSSLVYCQNRIIVTNTNDAGPGSLREAVNTANNDHQSTVITFHFLLSGKTIYLQSTLELTEDGTTIDGDMNGDGKPSMTLDGTNKSFTGIFINQSNSCTVEKLIIKNFSTGISALRYDYPVNNVIKQNRIFENGTGIVQSGTLISQNSITHNGAGIVTGFFGPPDVSLITNTKMYGNSGWTNSLIEFFSDSGFQGETYLGSTKADNSGNFSFDISHYDLDHFNINCTASFLGETTAFSDFRDWKNISGNKWVLDLGNQGSMYSNFRGGQPDFYTQYFSGGLLIGVLKDATESDPLKRYSVSEGRYTEFVPGYIENGNTDFSKLKHSRETGHPVFVIDQNKSGIYYDHWPSQFGAPVDFRKNPLVISEQDSWMIYNDADIGYHYQPSIGSNPGIGLEIQQMTYQFTDKTMPGLRADNTLFIRWKISNKTNRSYDSTYIGYWSDIDLRENYSNLLATDGQLRMVYLYHQPGVISFDGRYSAAGIELVHFSGDSGINANPSSAIWGKRDYDERAIDVETYSLLRGMNRDGSVRIYGDSSNPKFDFPGDPVKVQGILDTYPSDKRVLMSVGPFTFKAGTTEEIVFAVVGGSGNDRLSAVTNLKLNGLYAQTIFVSYMLYLFKTENFLAKQYTMRLNRNYPNPFNASTKISYQVSEPGFVDLKIYNILGQVVRTLVHENKPAGQMEIEWNGKDDTGNQVASGLYLYRLKTGSFQKTNKMLLIK